jgi:hypothetical protein
MEKRNCTANCMWRNIRQAECLSNRETEPTLEVPVRQVIINTIHLTGYQHR